MPVDQGLVDWVAEAMAPVGHVTARRMFGGAGLYCDGIIFALIAMDDLWFKADAESAAEWDALGADPFTYGKADGKVGVTSYRRAPSDAHDDADAMRRYGEAALGAARRKAAAKAPPRVKRTSDAG
jgi:DNA transformation protein